jgi:predicted SprT family Zn-dependent metalloprotease
MIDRHEAYKLLQQAQDLALQLMSQHGLTQQGWRFQWDRAVQRYGACSYRRKVIKLSQHLTVRNPIEETRNTILHEIAHALAGPTVIVSGFRRRQDHHGPRWKAIARAIGCTGDRCYGESVTRVEKPFIGTCPNGHTTEAYRRRRVSCSKCSPVFDPTLLFHWRRK